MYKHSEPKSERLWKDIEGYEGLYKVSNDGEVMSFRCKEPKFLSPQNNNRGYKMVFLTKDKNTKCFLVHRLVAEAFLPKVEGNTIVNHIDGNKTNNVVDNLEWSTILENTRHAYRNGLCDSKDDSKKVAVYRIEKDGTKTLFNSIKEAGDTPSLRNRISQCCRGIIKTADGYKWEYVNGGQYAIVDRLGVSAWL